MSAGFDGYAANRRGAIADAVDADPVAAFVREMMADRGSWAGSAADLLRAGADHSRDGIGRDSPDWPKNPRALAGRLRRAQTFLRALGIETPLAVRATPAAGLSESMRSQRSAPFSVRNRAQLFASPNREGRLHPIADRAD